MGQHLLQQEVLRTAREFELDPHEFDGVTTPRELNARLRQIWERDVDARFCAWAAIPSA